MSLRLRLAVLFSLASALAITVAGVLFIHQLRDDLNDTLDSGLRGRLADDISDLATDGRLDRFGPSEELTLVQNLGGTVVVATQEARSLSLTRTSVSWRWPRKRCSPPSWPVTAPGSWCPQLRAGVPVVWW